MKKILALVTAALTLGVIAPVSAEARPGRGHSSSSRVAYHCRDCGTPVRQVRYIAFYQRDGCPVYRWRTVSHHCHPRHSGHGHGHGGHGHGSGHGHRH